MFCDKYRTMVEEDEKEKQPKSFRVFERKTADGEYYTAHGDDALWVADEFFRTRDVVKYMGNEPKLAGCTIRTQKVITIAKHILIDKQSSFERMLVYGREEGKTEWSIIKKATPGNVAEFDDWLFEGANSSMRESSAIMALKITTNSSNEQLVGVGFVDLSLRTLDVCEFIDNDRFSNLESVILQRGAKECVVGSDSASSINTKKLFSLIERVGLPVTQRKPGDFKAQDIEQDLTRLVGSLDQHASKLECKNATAAIACLIKYTELLRDESGFGAFKLSLFDLSMYMKLDKTAMEALNLFPQPGETDKNMCLYGLLNKGRTTSGSRMLAQWIKQPLLDIKAIERRLDFVSLFVEDTSLRQALQEQHLRRVPDLDRMAKKFQKHKANLQTVVEFYRFAIALPGMMSALEGYEGEQADRLNKDFIKVLEELQKDLGQFEAMVEQTIDLDSVAKHEYLINPAFDDDLQDLANQKTDVEDRIHALASKTANELRLDEKKLKVVYQELHGYTFRVTRKDDKGLRKKNSLFTVLETKKDGVRFTSPKMKQLSSQHKDIKTQYETAQQEIVSKALEITESYTPVMEKMNEVLGELDVYVGLAHVSVNAPTPYVRPEVLEKGSGKLEFVGSRHPCMEMMDSVEFIPNDISLHKDKSNVQVITGPNMGGKSTYIRQAGVVCLMAQMGCFVPCESATVTVVDQIMARVGAGDNQMKGVSTFMKEMLEASSILSGSTEHSLIIIDELGRGTSTYDGFGLAWAISESIASKINSFTLFATHFHELTALANIRNNVVNRHATAHTSENSITMLYKVLDGPCDRSFGIHVSELANFPKEVIQSAKRKAAKLENFDDEVDTTTSTDAKRVKYNASGTKRITTEDEDDKENEQTNTLLSSFAKLPLKDMTHDQVRASLKQLRTQFPAHFAHKT